MTKKFWSSASGIAALVVGMALLYVPLLAVVAHSVTPNRYGLELSGFSTAWYAELGRDGGELERFGGRAALAMAAWNTVWIALGSATLAAVLGTALALGIARPPWRRRTRAWLQTAIDLPLLLPDIALAAALVIAFVLLRQGSDLFAPGLVTVFLGHVTFQLPFATLLILAALHRIGPEQDEAARDCYASTGFLLCRVLLPQLAPAIAAAWLLGAILSLDDFIITFFTKGGVDSNTLPMTIYAAQRRGLHPCLSAISTMVFVTTVLLVLAAAPLIRSRRIA